MDFTRAGALLGLAAFSAVGLTACSDDNTGSGEIVAHRVADVECGGKPSLRASGSTAQNNAMTVFANSYAVSCDGHTLDYNSNGSGAGVNEFTGGQTDFGGSDSPLKDADYAAAEQRCDSEAWNIPAVFGPIAVAYNLDGVDLTLSGPTIAKIFNGQIEKWDDPAIAAENDGVDLPDRDITVIYRSDESGTTDNFLKYLEAASEGAWTQGTGKTFTGGLGVGEGAKGNEGVSAAIEQTPGTVTYTEWSYAKNLGLDVVSIITPADAEGVTLDAETAGRTIDSAVFSNEGSNDLVIDTSSFYVPSAAGAYPIILPTYEIVCSRYGDAETARAVKAFLTVAVSAGVQEQLEGQGYIPIPDGFREKLNGAISAIS
ncbi:phosphate transport system substrate-binding protein [Dietzia sp. 2505]|uniref:phosphate ABC transporter substrate-binding protein PstS n=1 Tax=Dietzia sp. 2505 TaxID=3156457 RepID=UPI0033949826